MSVAWREALYLPIAKVQDSKHHKHADGVLRPCHINETSSVLAQTLKPVKCYQKVHIWHHGRTKGCDDLSRPLSAFSRFGFPESGLVQLVCGMPWHGRCLHGKRKVVDESCGSVGPKVCRTWVGGLAWLCELQ